MQFVVPFHYITVYELSAGASDRRTHASGRVGRHLALWKCALFDGEKFSLQGPRSLERLRGEIRRINTVNKDGVIGKLLWQCG